MKSYTYLKAQTLGDLLLVANETHLLGIYFPNHKNGPAFSEDWELNTKHPILKQASEELQEYLKRETHKLFGAVCF